MLQIRSRLPPAGSQETRPSALIFGRRALGVRSSGYLGKRVLNSRAPRSEGGGRWGSGLLGLREEGAGRPDSGLQHGREGAGDLDS